MLKIFGDILKQLHTINPLFFQTQVCEVSIILIQNQIYRLKMRAHETLFLLVRQILSNHPKTPYLHLVNFSQLQSLKSLQMFSNTTQS